MVVKISKWLALIGLAAVMATGCDTASDRDAKTESHTVVSGKAAQVYVRNAMVIADKIGVNGVGNFSPDVAEVFAYTNGSGDFTLRLPSTYALGDYVLCSVGGNVTNSQGAAEPAFPMLAPKTAANITPVTTLAVLNTMLIGKIGDGYDADIANESGVSWHVMQLAKSVEAVLAVFTHKENPMVTEISDEIAIVEKLAVELGDSSVDIMTDADIVSAVKSAVHSVVSDVAIIDDAPAGPTGMAEIVGTCVETILAAIPNEGVVTEGVILPVAEQAVATALANIHGARLAFNPDPANPVVPFPNDVLWAMMPGSRKGLVTLPVTADTDAATAALYTAMNALDLKGFSPNTPIWIPLEGSVRVAPAVLQNNIRVLNLGTLAPETGFKIIQEHNYVKLFPHGPLDANAQYLVYIVDRANDPADDFVTDAGVRIREPAYYTPLKSTEPLTGSLAALEELRQSYAPVYGLLGQMGVARDDTLLVFTFTTADKTLSADDFAYLVSYLDPSVPGIDSLEMLAGAVAQSPNLPYVGPDGAPFVAMEFNAIFSQIPQVTSVDVPVPGTFISVDLQKQSDPATQGMTPVPYTLYNSERYGENRTVVIFQHGYGRTRADAGMFAEVIAGANLPVLAMDLPLHGDRALQGMPTGYGFLSTNIPQTRMNFHQTYFDLTVMVRNLAAGYFDLDGDGDRDENDVPLSIYFGGQSMGAVTGSVFSSYNTDLLEKILLNVGGAGFGAVADGATVAEITNLVDAFGVEKYTNEYFILLALFQTLMDPVDPVNLVNSGIREKTLIQTAYMDTFVPNVANELLAYTIGYPLAQRVAVTDFSVFSGAENASPGWYHFGGMPGKSGNWIKHGFLFDPTLDGYPEIPEGYLDPVYLMDAHNAVRDQTVAFFNN